MESTQPTDLITTAEAKKILKVSQPKMTELLKQGYLRYFQTPLDRRVKLVSKAEVLALKTKVEGQVS
jgi:hypothetical protein